MQLFQPLLGSMVFVFSDMSTLSLLSSLLGYDADLYIIAHLLLLCLGLTIIGCLLGVCLSDAWGRRPLFLHSLCLLSVLWATIMLITAERQYSISLSLGWARFLRILGFLSLSFVCCLQGISGVVSWIYCHETFPLRVRSKASSLVTAFFFIAPELSAFLIHALQPRIIAEMYSFLFFAVILSLFVFLFARETRYHRVEDMEELFSVSHESYACCCPLLGLKSYEEQELTEAIPLTRGRVSSSHNTVEVHPSPITAEVAFEPDRLHKYSSSLQALEFKYMALPKFERRERERAIVNTALRPTSPPIGFQ